MQTWIQKNLRLSVAGDKLHSTGRMSSRQLQQVRMCELAL